MSKVLLIDFEEIEINKLREFSLDISCEQTNWLSQRTDSLEPPKDCQIIFYKVNKDDASAAVHINDGKKFISFVKQGGIIISFVGNCNNIHNITNLIGHLDDLYIGPTNPNPTSIKIAKPSPFEEIFSRFGHQIIVSRRLGMTAGYNPTEAFDFETQKQVIAKQGSDDAAVYFKRGKGFYLLLPLFEDIAAVSYFILNNTIKEIRPDLYEDKAKIWINKPDYCLPGLQKAILQKEEIETEYEANIIVANKKIEIERQKQKIFNDLLTESGDALVLSVRKSLNYIGFATIDVDEYFEEESKEKDEDLWLFESKNGNVNKNFTIITEVKGIKGSASNDDCNVLNTYLKRRMQETKNTNMKGLLIVNHYRFTDPGSRNKAFSDRQIQDAERDKHVLLSTPELFKLIKAEQQSEITREHIKQTISESIGEILAETLLAKNREEVIN